MGLEEESTHVSRTRPNPLKPVQQQKPEEKDDLQSRMKRLMKHPELWIQYKNLLSKEETPDSPDTIRRLLVEYWDQYEEELLRFEAQAATTAALLSSPAPRPPRLSSSFSSSKGSSIFQAFNTDLDGESQHFLSSKSSASRPSNPKPIQPQDTTQRQLRLLRSSPDLYAKYQERLLMDESEEDTPAADLLTKFLREHASELSDLERADQEAKEQQASDASLLHLETATLAEEQSETKFDRSQVTNQSEPRSRSTRPDPRQKLMVYRDSISSRSMRSVQIAMGALAGEMEESVTPTPSRSTPSRPSLSSQSEHHTTMSQRDRRQQFTTYRDTISSRSKRAMDALAGEVEENHVAFKEKGSSSQKSLTSQSEHHSNANRGGDRRQQFTAYRDTISSRSKRAMDALAGEVGDTSAPQNEKSTSLSSQSEHHPHRRDRRQQLIAYRDTMSSRSKRAVEELAGELGAITQHEPSPSTSEATDLKSTVASLVAWGQNFTLSMTSELEEPSNYSNSVIQPENIDLGVMPYIGGIPGTGPFHASTPMNNFDMKSEDDVGDDDLVLRQAAKIADRRRRSDSRSSAITLEPIADDEEDGSVSEHLGASSADSTTEADTTSNEEALSATFTQTKDGEDAGRVENDDGLI